MDPNPRDPQEELNTTLEIIRGLNNKGHHERKQFISDSLGSSLRANVPVSDMTDSQLLLLHSSALSLLGMIDKISAVIASQPIADLLMGNTSPSNRVDAVSYILQQDVILVILDISAEIDRRPALMERFKDKREGAWQTFRAIHQKILGV